VAQILRSELADAGEEVRHTMSVCGEKVFICRKSCRT
jgi:hypothetical protein